MRKMTFNQYFDDAERRLEGMQYIDSASDIRENYKISSEAEFENFCSDGLVCFFNEKYYAKITDKYNNDQVIVVELTEDKTDYNYKYFIEDAAGNRLVVNKNLAHDFVNDENDQEETGISFNSKQEAQEYVDNLEHIEFKNDYDFGDATEDEEEEIWEAEKETWEWVRVLIV